MKLWTSGFFLCFCHYKPCYHEHSCHMFTYMCAQVCCAATVSLKPLQKMSKIGKSIDSGLRSTGEGKMKSDNKRQQASSEVMKMFYN